MNELHLTDCDMTRQISHILQAYVTYVCRVFIRLILMFMCFHGDCDKVVHGNVNCLMYVISQF